LTTEPLTLNLEPTIFVGDSSNALARVYAALPRLDLPDDVRLEGELVGPYCRHSQTLPARIRFIDRGPGPTLLSEATAPDPCFWTPELPFMYSLELRAVQGDETIAAVKRPFGIRRLGVHGKSLYLDAKRFVLRGVRIDPAAIDDLKTAKHTASALFVSNPSDEFLQEASKEGVLLAVELQASQFTNELSRLGRWPAVAVVFLDTARPAGKELRLAARNTLLAQNLAAADTPVAPSAWAHLLWWQVDADKTPAAAPSHNLPIIAYRPTSKNATIEERRRACDRLQADLAPLGDFAGYFT
jgi:hypothetical protein